MAATTGIPWTDGTVNFWIGCTMVGPGCGEVMPDGRQIGCYAEAFARHKFAQTVSWGPGGKRHRTQAGYESPLRYQRMHDRGQLTMRQLHQDVPVPRWVFCNSLSDFFDNEIDPQWRADAWAVIRDTPALRWQIVTKRVGNVADMLPADWGDGSAYSHVGVICTMVNQQEVDRDARKLLTLKDEHRIRWVGLSIEPQLGDITLTAARGYGSWRLDALRGVEVTPTVTVHSFHNLRHPNLHNGLDWVICGGESNQGEHKARPFELAWARLLRDECAAADVPFFMKQFGDNPVPPRGDKRGFGQSGANPELWPRDLQVQQMPRVFDDDPPYQPKNLPMVLKAPTLL